MHHDTFSRVGDDLRQEIKARGIVAILRGDYPIERLEEVAGALAEGGVSILEITMNSPRAIEAILHLARALEGWNILLGAGTVRTVRQFEEAVGAGALFTVAPHLDPACVELAQKRNILHIPGVLTPTEAERAHQSGCRMVKLFPADLLGPGYLRALRAPLDDIECVPTGGISSSNLGQFVKAGAVAVGIGSALLKGADQSLDDLRGRARALRLAWDQEHGKLSSI